MDEDEQTENDLNYVNLFQSHLDQFHDLLSGIDRTDGPLPPSYLPPYSFWTSEEKSLFFHALSVHSKLRPDLIADEIPGKNLVDVLIYLDLLDAAATKDVSRKRARAAFEAALEVSDEWVIFEEEQARLVTEKEVEWEKDYREEWRLDALREKEREVRSSIIEKEGGGRNKDGRRRINQEVRQIQAEMHKRWRKADYLKELSGPHLRAIDHILREAEEPTENRETLEEELVGHGLDPPHPDTAVANAVSDAVIDPALLAISRPITPPPPPLHANEDLAAVDEPPLEVSTSPAPSLQPPSPNQLGRAHSTSPQDELGLTSRGLAALSPRSRRRHQKRLYMRRKRAQATGGIVSATVARLKPGRKTNKKLERQLAKAKEREERELALLNGLNDGEDTNVDLDTAGFTITSEETKEEYLDVNAGKEEFEISLPKVNSERSESEGMNEEDHRHPNVGGTTLPYKIIKDLLDMGYNADTLEREGLGLFHLTGLYRIMGLHASLRSVEDDIGTCISASTIRLLHAYVSIFLHKIIQLAIALRDQERKSKAHTKVWRLNHDLIKTATVHEAVQMMGVEKDKKFHFASLVDRLTCLDENIAQTKARHEKEEKAKGKEKVSVDEDEDDPSQLNSEESDEDQEDQESEDEDAFSSRQRPLPSLPAHIEINQPFIRHSSLDYLLPNLFRAATTEDESSLLPEEIDSDAVLKEISEERELDALDRAMSKEEETKLWERMKKRKRVEAEPDTILDVVTTNLQGDSHLHDAETRAGLRRSKRRAVHTLQFVEPNASLGIKSTIFVDDSD